MALHALTAALHVKAIVDLMNHQHGPTDEIVLAAYNREKYNELRDAPGDLFHDAHRRLTRLAAESLIGFELMIGLSFRKLKAPIIISV